MKTVLILCPLPEELASLLEALDHHGFQYKKSLVGMLDIYEFAELGWILGLGGHGKTQFGIQTQYLINHFKELSLVVCCGCAGGLVEEVAIFDVVVANKTVEHDYNLKFVNRPDPVFLGCEGIFKKVQNFTFDSFTVHIAAIASGDEDIIDLDRAIELRNQTNCSVVAWEGAGGARASQFNKIPFLEIRGITDSANNDAPVDFSKNLKKAMSNIGDVLLKIL